MWRGQAGAGGGGDGTPSPTRFRSKGSSEGGCPVFRTPGIFEAVQSRRAPRCLFAFWTCASVEVLPGALRGRKQPSHVIPLVPARTIRSFRKARGRARERLPTRVSREHWPRSLAPIFHFHRSRRHSARSTSSFLVLDDPPVKIRRRSRAPRRLSAFWACANVEVLPGALGAITVTHYYPGPHAYHSFVQEGMRQGARGIIHAGPT